VANARLRQVVEAKDADIAALKAGFAAELARLGLRRGWRSWSGGWARQLELLAAAGFGRAGCQGKTPGGAFTAGTLGRP
jgi:hypothetical protein